MATTMSLRGNRSAFAVVTLAAAWAACGSGCSIDSRQLTLHDAGTASDAQVNPASLVIATFEHGTAKPDDPRFQTFQYYAYSESPESVLTSPLAVPGHDSNGALGLNWVVFDPPNGQPDYPGVGVRTVVNGTIDLTAYSRIVFGLKYAPTPSGGGFPDAGACAPVPALTVTIWCNEHNTSFRKNVAMPADWTTITATFADFREPSYLPATGTALNDCLKVVNMIDFSAEVDLLDGQCASGALLLDDISVRMPLPTDGGADGVASTGIALVPDGDGRFDGTNAAGVIGHWWATGDDFGDGTGIAGAGPCPMAGFPPSACSTLATPSPLGPFTPAPNGKGMCTSGIAAQVLTGSDGMPAYSSIWGNIIGLDLANPDSGPLTASGPPYDAVAHGITGFAFDIDAVPPGGHLRVGFATAGTETNPAYWDGAINDVSPIFAAAHYEMRWAEIGGPAYLGAAAPAFDPRTLKWIQFHVVSNISAPIPYGFCISNATLLTN